MNYYDARELTNKNGRTGTFHYTCMNDGIIWPVGYCRNHPGHATKDEAYACWRRYNLDNNVREITFLDTAKRCEHQDCNEWTDKAFEVGQGRFYMLCDLHRTKDYLEFIYDGEHTVTSSY